jgi:hypothetical protein
MSPGIEEASLDVKESLGSVFAEVAEAIGFTRTYYIGKFSPAKAEQEQEAGAGGRSRSRSRTQEQG